MDIFYVRDVRGHNCMFLGVICETIHLHTATLLQSRKPDEVSWKFQLTWARSFGYPALNLTTDPDGSFQSTFEDDMNNAGVFVDFVPAESHDKMGLVERHNTVLRTVMEKMIDDRGIVGQEDMELVAATAGGRPAYVAAFGRIPRHGLNLLSDENALLVGQTRHEAQQLAGSLRVEARQHRCVHRFRLSTSPTSKTTTTEPLTAPPGSSVAYWRWTARSGKKRGSYRLARL